MNKKDLYILWKKDYLLDDILIEKIILKNLNIKKSNLFLLEEISEVEYILKDFELYKKWTPIEYILWNADFFWLEFIVDNRVLIPRNDTEIMVKEVLKSVENIDFTLIDIWTWSSCIPISILKNISKIPLNTYVLDISDNALEVSKINIEKHALEKEIFQIKSDLLEEFLYSKNYKLEKNLIITANLPYIKNEDIDSMDDWVFFFEPNIALFWWKETWFELYEKLFRQIEELKKFYEIQKITLFIEIWFDQYEYSKTYLKKLWLKFEYFKDMNWIFRCIKIEF